MNFSDLESKQKAIVILTVVTAIIHLLIGIATLNEGGVIFILNFLGYVSLIVALYFLPQFEGNQNLVRYSLVLYTLTTILAYFAIFWPDEFINPLGLGTKLIEFILVGLLLFDKSETII